MSTEPGEPHTGLSEPDLNLTESFIGRLDGITRAAMRPLPMVESRHSPEEKSFLGFTIPQGTSGRASIERALDHLMSHPNVGPFVGRQLIQRFVTSNPSPNAAFTDDRFGKVREPILRLSHFMRTFDADMPTPEYVFELFDTSAINVFGQDPFRSPSVVNFYRPGYGAPGTLSGDLGLTVPELQIVNASSTPGYINLLSYGAFQSQRENFERMRPVFNAFRVPFDADRARATLSPTSMTSLRS